MMQNLEKFGYFMIGTSFGVFVATKLYERELSRPIGDIEEHVFDIPENDINIPDAKEAVEEIASAVDVKRKREFNELRRTSENVKTDYKAMFDETQSVIDKVDTKISEMANDISEKIGNLNIDELDDVPADDILPDVEKADDTEYIKERVEEWIEVYLGENPQDPIELVYYAGDTTLCDDREQLITNPDEVVGTVALDRLVNAGPGAENGVIFVRNLKTMLDYEIILDLGKYGETVLGIFESNLEKEDGGDAAI